MSRSNLCPLFTKNSDVHTHTHRRIHIHCACNNEIEAFVCARQNLLRIHLSTSGLAPHIATKSNWPLGVNRIFTDYWYSLNQWYNSKWGSSWNQIYYSQSILKFEFTLTSTCNSCKNFMCNSLVSNIQMEHSLGIRQSFVFHVNIRNWNEIIDDQ